MSLHLLDTAALVVLPSLAFAYTASAAFFLRYFAESVHWTAHSKNLLLCLSVLTASLAVYVVRQAKFDYSSNTYSGNDNSDDHEYPFLSFIKYGNHMFTLLSFILASLYMIVRTRVEIIEGGPEPHIFKSDEPLLQDKIVIITGANAGIGKETARLLLIKCRAKKVILACRSKQRAQESIQDLVGSSNVDRHSSSSSIRQDQLDFVQLDLSSLDSVRQAAQQVKDQYAPGSINVLINNAGVMMGTQQFTKDENYELVMQANHLGHYLWTRLLLENGVFDKDSESSCIVNVTSSTYRFAGLMDLDDLFCTKGQRPYTLFGQYAQSKLANILFTTELSRRLSLGASSKSDSTKSDATSGLSQKQACIQVHAVHPGMVRTDVTRNMPLYLRIPNQLFAFIVAAYQKTPVQGAWCSTYVATAAAAALPEVGKSGQYWVNCQPQELAPCAQDDQAAKELWSLSAKLVGLPE